MSAVFSRVKKNDKQIAAVGHPTRIDVVQPSAEAAGVLAASAHS